MKVLVATCLLALALAGPAVTNNPNRQIVPDEAIEFINSSQSKWVASNKWTAGMTLGEAKKYASSLIVDSPFPERNWGLLADMVTVPDSFEASDKWPGCVGAVRNQKQCGSCWAFGAVEALADRICIDTNGAEKVVLSPQYLLDCDKGAYGCDGGYPVQAWQYDHSYGVPTEECVPYAAVDQRCPNTCQDGSPFKFYKAGDPETYSTPSSIQMALMEGGPVETAFTVYEDFYSYTSGVYIHTWGGVVGGHAVKIVGWGKQGDINYWIIHNSWGTDWGMDGIFWIEFGQCGIDSQAVASPTGNKQ